MSEILHRGPCLARAFAPRHLPIPHSEEFVAARPYLWTPGATIRVVFGTRDGAHPEWGGTPEQRAAALAATRVWEQYANIHFVQVGDPLNADIRCSFEPGSSWSMVGTDCHHGDPNQQTMNLGWDYDTAMLVHEFGHALGLEHEQGNPAVIIPWNKPALYAYYGGPPNNWDPSEVDSQVIARYGVQGLIFSAWDRLSIMQYPIGPEMVTDPSFVVGWNAVPSATDIRNIARLYPR